MHVRSCRILISLAFSLSLSLRGVSREAGPRSHKPANHVLWDILGKPADPGHSRLHQTPDGMERDSIKLFAFLMGALLTYSVRERGRGP